MELTISQQGYTEKPKIPGITYDKVDVEPKALEAYIRKGHVLSANFDASYPITQKDRTLSNFSSIPYVMIDMDDDVYCELEVLIDSLTITPTIAYSTFSHGTKGNRYRLLFFFDSQIEKIEDYKSLYSFICKECNLNLKDNCGNNPVQACIGSKADCEYIFTDNIYKLKDFIEEDKDYKLGLNNSLNESGHEDYILKEKKRSNIQFTCPVDLSEEYIQQSYDSTFLNDYFNCSYKAVLDKYRYKYNYFDKTPLPKVDPDTPVIILPENYVEIKRYYFKEAILDSYGKIKTYTNKVRKIRDGEGRRRKIYTSTLLRKVMKPDISFPHLLYCGLFDLYNYCYNEDDPISKKQLYDVVMNAARKSPRESLIERSRPSMKYVANPDYCDKHHVSRQKATGDYRHLLKEKKYVEVGKLYNPYKTYEENLWKMKEEGLDVSIKDIQRYRIENNLPPLPRKSKKRSNYVETSKEESLNAIHQDNSESEEYIHLTFCPIDEEERRRIMADVISNALPQIA